MSEKPAQPRHPESVRLNSVQPGKAPRKLALRPYARAVGQVLKVSFKASPAAVIMKVAGSLISAMLPLVTTYFAALTTTALAAGYAGDPDAGPQAILYVIITAALGLFWGAFSSVDRYIQQLMSFKVGAIVGDMMYERFRPWSSGATTTKKRWTSTTVPNGSPIHTPGSWTASPPSSRSLSP